jgi:ankyrin repeat protein
MISTLLQHGADPNLEYDDIGPLIYLVTDGSWSPFMEQRWDCVKLLLEAGANVSHIASRGFSIMEAAWESGHGEPLVRLMLELDLRPELPTHEVRLISAVKRRQIRLAQSLLALGVSPNCRSKTDQAGATPLMLAAAGGDFDMAQLLLAHGALPKTRTQRSRRQDLKDPAKRSHFVSESTALEFAVNRGMYRVVQLLLLSAGKSTGSPSDRRLAELAQKMERSDLETLLGEYNYKPDNTPRGTVIPFELAHI